MITAQSHHFSHLCWDVRAEGFEFRGGLVGREWGNDSDSTLNDLDSTKSFKVESKSYQVESKSAVAPSENQGR